VQLLGNWTMKFFGVNWIIISSTNLLNLISVFGDVNTCSKEESTSSINKGCNVMDRIPPVLIRGLEFEP